MATATGMKDGEKVVKLFGVTLIVLLALSYHFWHEPHHHIKVANSRWSLGQFVSQRPSSPASQFTYRRPSSPVWPIWYPGCHPLRLLRQGRHLFFFCFTFLPSIWASSSVFFISKWIFSQEKEVPTFDEVMPFFREYFELSKFVDGGELGGHQ